MDESAVNHVYELKNRPRDKAMNLNVASYEDIPFYSKEQPMKRNKNDVTWFVP